MQTVEEERPGLHGAGLPCCFGFKIRGGQGDELQQQVVEFVLVADVWPELLADSIDGGLVEPAGAIG
jgi:putative lipoic acid-binding regulatory protein